MGFIPLKPTVNAGAVIGAQNITVGSSVTSFATFSVFTNVLALQVSGNDLYVTFDGTTPSSSNGGQMFAGQSYHWDYQTARSAKFIQQSATSTIFAQEFVNAEDATAMPICEVLKPRLTVF